MSTFPLQIGTPDGLLFEGDVARVCAEALQAIWQFLPGTVISVRLLAWEKPM